MPCVSVGPKYSVICRHSASLWLVLLLGGDEFLSEFVWGYTGSTMSAHQRHPYHLVSPSAWPLLSAFSAFLTTFGAVMWMHSYAHGGFVLALALLSLVLCMTCWWLDVVKEATFQGFHTTAVQAGLRLGVVLFIVSEVMFFFGFFWAFFHSSLSPTFQIGCVWPPVGIVPFNPWGVPLLNTLILLLSGLTITAVHGYIVSGDSKDAVEFYGYTLFLAALFTFFQAYEYKNAPFSISDGVYGSTFFMATGFHGFHVIVGTIFIFVCLIRTLLSHFTSSRHIGFEAAAWYWHFVDVVWLFLFVTVYWWGGL